MLLLDKAKEMIEKALEVYSRAIGRGAIQVANCYLTLGKIMICQQEFEDALRCLK